MLLITQAIVSRRKSHRRWIINIAVLVSVTLLFVIGYFSASASHTMQVGLSDLLSGTHSLRRSGRRLSLVEKRQASSVDEPDESHAQRLRRFLLDEDDDDQVL